MEDKTLHGISQSGFEYTISEDARNDWEMIELLEEMDEGGSPSLLIQVYKKLLGDEQYKALKEHLRKKNGIVPADQMMSEFRSILEGASDTKN